MQTSLERESLLNLVLKSPLRTVVLRSVLGPFKTLGKLISGWSAR